VASGENARIEYTTPCVITAFALMLDSRIETDHSRRSMMKKYLVTAGVALLGAATITRADVFVVTSTADDGSPNTLRWAVGQNNAHPGANTIQVQPATTPFVIKLNSLLPPIIGPAIVTASGPGVALDGGNFIDGNDQASCPGETGGFGPNVRSLQKPGLAVVDSGNVEISNLEVRNFCIGILLLRSHDNHIHHNTVHHVSGAAGIAVTGDDGTPAGGATVGLSTRNLIEYNRLYETGDGMECTRGTTFTTYQYNVGVELRDRPNVAYSQGIECAGNGNDNNIIQFNSFKGYSDGLQMNSASNLTVLGNTLVGNTYGITTSGAGVLIKENLITANRMGVGVTGNAAHAMITQNRIYGNGVPLLSVAGSAGGTTNAASPALIGIDLGVDGVTANDLAASCADGFPDCDAGPNDLQNFPVLATSSSWAADGTIVVNGTLPSRPNASYTLEFFASHALNRQGFGEGEVYLGSTTVVAGPTGQATFTFHPPTGNPLNDGSTMAYFTATAMNGVGSTSEFSAPVQLTKGASPPVN
jgi:3-dehydroshikimate dehydratase